MQHEPSTLREWLRDHPAPDSALTQSVAGIAERMLEGDDFFVAVRELLDEFALLQTDEQRERSLAAPPPSTGSARFDAYLAALAEYLAGRVPVPRPAWTAEPARFLESFWFVSPVKAFRPLALAESPAAFRRRGIFVSAGSLQRC